MGSERLEYVDILKGIGILLVIFSHSGAEGGAMMYVGGVFIPLFFIASGYTSKPLNKSLLSLLRVRTLRLLKPYSFFSLLLLLLYQRFTFLDIAGIFYSRYCLYPYGSGDNLILMGGGSPPLWFLTSLLTASVPFFLLQRYSKYTSWLILLFLAYTFVCQFLPVLLPWSLDTACLMAIFMYMGLLLRNGRWQQDFPLTYGLMLLVVYVLLCTLNGELNVSVREYGYSFLLYLLTGLTGTVILLRVSRFLQGSRIGEFLATIGRHSLVIFCIQMFLLRLSHQLFHQLLSLPVEGLSFYLISVIKILLVAVVGLYISKFIHRYMSWIVH